MKKLILLAFLTLPLAAQGPKDPPAFGANINDGSGWSPWTSAAGFGAIAKDPPEVGLYCKASVDAPWTPCVPGGSPTGTAGGDLSGTYPNPAVAAVHATSGTLDGVVIGGTTPAAASVTTLNVNGGSGRAELIKNNTSSIIDILDIENDNSSGFASVGINDSSGTFAASFGFGNSGSSSPGNVFFATNSHPIQFCVNSAQTICLKEDTSGNVTVPTLTTPSASVLASTTPNDLACFSNTTGHLSDCNIQRSISNSITSATGGTGISAVTCSTAACTNLRGTYTMTATTVSAGTILTLAWPTTTTAYACQTVQNGGATSLGLGHSVATATGMTITNAVSVPITGTIVLDYECQP